MSLSLADYCKVLSLAAIYLYLIAQAARSIYLSKQAQGAALASHYLHLQPLYSSCDAHFKYCTSTSPQCPLTYEACRSIALSAAKEASGRCRGYIDSYNACIDRGLRCETDAANARSCLSVMTEKALSPYLSSASRASPG